MKLHEIVSSKDTKLKVTVEPAGGIYGKFGVVVHYELESASVSQHVSGDSSTREKHTGSLVIGNVELAQDVYKQDADGKNTDQVWKKGTDATKLPGWDRTDNKYVYDEVADTLQD